MSSSVTLIVCCTDLPFLGPYYYLPPIPPPNIAEKISFPCIPPPCNPSSPCSSYISLFSLSLRISYAAVINLNFSGSPPLSGCSFRANL